MADDNNDQKPDIDSRYDYNPYNRASKSLDEQEREASSGGVATKTDDNSEGSSSAINEREETGNSGWRNSVVGKAMPSKKLSLASIKGRKGATLGATGAFAAVGMIFSIFGGFLAPIHLLENAIDMFNDQLGAMEVRSNRLLRTKIDPSERAKAISGCRTLSIKCKFATLSSKEIARLNRAGVTVTGETNAFGRTKPIGYTFQNQSYSAEGWLNAIETSDSARRAQLRANNMSYLGFADRHFTGKVLARFGVTKAAPGLKGSRADRMNQLLTASGASRASDISMRVVTDADGNEKYALFNGDTRVDPDTTYEKDAADRINRDLERQRAIEQRNASRSGGVRLPKGVVGALSVTGYYDVACSINNMLGAALITAKVAKNADIVQYGMTTITLAHKLKAGDATPEDAETLLEYWNKTDDREMIPAAPEMLSDAELEAYMAGDNVGAGEMVENPNYKKSALDQELPKYVINGGVPVPSQSRSALMLGGGYNSFFGFLEGFQGIVDTLVNVGTDGTSCAFVQNWVVRGIGTAIAIVGAFFSAGTTVAIQAGIMAGMVAAMFFISYQIEKSLSGNLFDIIADDPNNTDLAGDAPVLAVGILGTTAAQVRGMNPGADAVSYRQYQELNRDVKLAYADMRRSESNPLDVNDPYSVVGSIAWNAYRNYHGETFTGKILKTPQVILGTLTNDIYAQQETVDCDDQEYNELGLNTGVQCLIYYSMSQEELDSDPLVVAEYMENNGYVEVDTETGLPENYIPPNMRQKQEGITQALKDATIGSFVSQAPDLSNDYAYFLDYCAYRVTPYGKQFEDTNSLSQLSSDVRAWQSGEKCKEDSEMLSMFRVYTFDISVQDATDEAIDPGESATTVGEGWDGAGGGDALVSGEWTIPTTGSVTSNFGMRTLSQTGVTRLHAGVDIAAPTGTPVYAASAGVARTTYSSGGGNIVEISHAGGIRTRYLHLDSYEIPRGSNTEVRAGQLIGRMGNTGRSYGSHLHFETHVNGNPTDPRPFMAQRGVTIPPKGGTITSVGGG